MFSKLFGGKSKPEEVKPVDHEGFLIYPEPEKVGAHFRIGARIEKEINGEIKSHMMIRVDTLQTKEEAITASIGKAQLMIQQQGDGIFG